MTAHFASRTLFGVADRMMLMHDDPATVAPFGQRCDNINNANAAMD
jgi:hypothetical protein